jgi:hypothetical protein
MEVKILMRKAGGMIITSCGGLDNFSSNSLLGQKFASSLHGPHADGPNPSDFNLEFKDCSHDEGERDDVYFHLPGEEDLVTL